MKYSQRSRRATDAKRVELNAPPGSFVPAVHPEPENEYERVAKDAVLSKYPSHMSISPANMIELIADLLEEREADMKKKLAELTEQITDPHDDSWYCLYCDGVLGKHLDDCELKPYID